MAIFLGSTIINKKLLGVNKLNKIMLGVIEVFPNLGNVTPTAPIVTSVLLTSATGQAGHILNTGDTVTATVQFNQAVIVNSGTPTLGFDIGGTLVTANYNAGSGGSSLSFRYTILDGQNDADGIAITANSLAGDILGANGLLPAVLTHAGAPSNPSYTVDTEAPYLLDGGIDSAIGIDGDTLNEGDVVKMFSTFNEVVLVTGVPQLRITIGSQHVYADYVSGSNSNTIYFDYTILDGQEDSNGISIDSNSIFMNGGSTIKGLGGNAATYTHAAVPDNPAYKVVTTNGAAWTPQDLFSSGEQGVWYDLDDDMDTKLQWCLDNPAYTNATFLAQFPNHTLFQDSVGATAVTAVEQPLGLVLDKSKGLALGAELVTNGGFDTDTGWTKGTGWTISGGVATANTTDGAQRLEQLYNGANGQFVLVTATITMLATPSPYATVGVNIGGIGENLYATSQDNLQQGVTYTIRAIAATTSATTWLLRIGSGYGFNYPLNYTIDNVSLKAIAGNHASQATTGSKPKWSARKNLLLATDTMSTQNITSVATPYTISHTGTGTITLSGTSTAGPLVGAGSLTFTPTAGTLTMTVSGTVSNAQLEYGSTATAYQSVVTATDYNAIGFPKGAKFDGVDDFLSTASVDFSAVAQMFVCSGVQKTSDALEGTIVELSAELASNNGSFRLLAPASTSGDNFGYVSKGTAQALALAGATYPSPSTQVLSGQSDTFNDVCSLRIAGAQAASNGADQGNQSYGNYPLYIGRRAGTSLPFTGVESQLIVLNRLPTSDELTKAEAFVSTKLGV